MELLDEAKWNMSAMDDDLGTLLVGSDEEAYALATLTAGGGSNASDVYDYDLDLSLATFNYYDLVPTAIVYGITLIAGLIGNGLIVYTVSHFRRMRTLSNVFLASLASADLLLIIVCVPVKFGQLFSYTWEFGEILCKLVHYMQNVSAICSVLTLTAMSIERYYAIIHPVKSRYLCTMSQTRRIIIFTWISAFITATPLLFIMVYIEVGDRHRAYWCVKDWSRPVLWRAYECYMLLLILVIPSLVMSYTYACICHRLWIVIKQRASMVCGQSNFGEVEMKRIETTAGSPTHGTKSPDRLSPGHKAQAQAKRPLQQMYTNKSDDDASTVRQVIKMLVAVVILFILCWSPILIINLLTSFGVLNALNYGYLKPLRTGAHLLSYINSCVNPCVYGFMSHNFRASFKAALSKCFGCQRAPYLRGSQASSYRAPNSSTLVSRATTLCPPTLPRHCCVFFVVSLVLVSCLLISLLLLFLS